MNANARVKPQLIAAVMIVLILVAGCGKTGSTPTSVVQPSDTPFDKAHDTPFDKAHDTPSFTDTPVSEGATATPQATPTVSRTPESATVPPTIAPTSPSIDSGGGQIVFYSNRDGSNEIYAVDADGGGLRQLTDNNASDMGPAWSPDGTQVVFVSDRDGNKEIYVMRHDGSDPKRLTNDPAYESHPAWSPDGARIAFISERDGNEEIYVMNFDGSDPQRLTNDPAEDIRPAWSPDGKYLVFNSERDGNWEIYVIDVAAVLQGSGDSAPRRLTDSRGWELFPVWSPDGTQIAYRCGPATPRGDICVVNAQEALQGDFSGEQRLTRHGKNDENPSWSPDGTQIVFQSDRYASSQTTSTGVYNYELMIVNSDGSDVRRLTDNPAGDYWPAWSPRSVGGAPAAPAFALPPGGSLGDTWTRPADGMTMVYAPGGAFRMGSDVGDVEAARDESPQHSVALDAFWIDQTEVSVAQFRRFVTETGYETEAEKGGWSLVWTGTELSQVDDADWQHPQGPDSQAQDDHPVVAVSWNDALIYCKWAGVRLPTEAEWEYAARGPRGLVYPWGDDFDCSRANLDDETQLDDYVVPGGEGCDGYAMTAPVGSLADGASWCNVLDMSGNVWEWVADWYGSYLSDKQANPAGPKTGGSKVLRGGGWYSAEEHARAAERGYHAPDNGYANVGFRCASAAALPTATAVPPTPTPTTTPPPTPSPEAGYQPLFEPTVCRFSVPSGYESECGDLVVPEDRSQPQGPTVRLHVAIFRSRNPNPEPDPVVYLAGGGGHNHLGSSAFYLRSTGAILDKRDYIMYNQRGAPLNEPALQCPDYTDFLWDLAGQGLSLAEREAQTIEFLLDCRDALRDQGINLHAYNSVANAADLDDLRVALGHDQINVYGTSYGTKLALTAMRYYPHGIRSAIIDSVYPPQIQIYETLARTAHRAYDAIFQDCAADSYCNQTYPDLEATFYRVVDELNANPIPLVRSRGTIMVDGGAFMDAIFSCLYRAGCIPQVPAHIDRASKGDLSGMAWAIEGNLGALSLSWGVYHSMQCREEVPFGSHGEALALSANLLPAITDYFTSPFHYTLCESWESGRAAPIENMPVVSKVPTLVLAGRYDPITPPAWGALAAETLLNSFYYEFPNLGHGVMRSSACGLEIGLQFIDDPTAEPDASCIDTLSAPDFK